VTPTLVTPLGACDCERKRSGAERIAGEIRR